MRLFCWNVNSLVPTVRNINLKYGSLAAFFAHLDADIICIQEVKLPDAKLTKDLVIVEGYQSYWACSQSKTGYSGVTTWVRQCFAATSAEADPLNCEGCDKEGRAIVTDHGTFVLFNVYVPNAGDRPARSRLPAKLSFLAALRQQVEELMGAGRQVILVGDFNIAADPADVHDAISWEGLYHPSELQALSGLTGPESCACVDTWRHLHPHTRDVYTVWEERKSARSFNVGCRIDYALISPGLMPALQSSEVLLDLPPKWSDHAPLLLQLYLQPLYAGPAPAAAAAPAADSKSTDVQQLDTHHQHQERQQQQQQQQLPAPPECPMWQQLLKRFQDPSQRSIAAMFRTAGKQKPAGKAAAAAAPAAATLAASATAAAAAAAPGANAKSAQDPDPVKSQQPSLRAVQKADPGRSASVAAARLLQSGKQQEQQLQQMAQEPQHQQQHNISQEPEQQQPQQQQQPPQQQQQHQAKQKASSQSSSRQPAAIKKRAAGKADTSGAKDPKQAKLHSFFARSASGGD